MVDWYFAYGSNMNAARMRARGLEFSEAMAGSLPGFGLRFNKRAVGKQGVAYANIQVAPGERVEGVLYRLVEREAITVMDRFEGSPVRYSREAFRVQSEQGEVAAWIYVANAAMLDHNVLPERPYLEHLLAGREHLSEAYHRAIAQHPALEVTRTGGQHSLLFNE